MSRRGLVLGAGGTVGHAWTLAALRRLEAATGWDPRSASVLVGTSAGSVIATRLAAGQSVAEQIAAGTPQDAHIPPRPRGGPQSLGLFGRGLLGKVPPLAALTGLLPAGRGKRFELARGVPLRIEHPACWVVAMDVDSGERVAFGRAGSPPASYADAVAASCAVPGWVEPVVIGGRRYLDGGALSATSADLVQEVDEVIIVSPMTSARFAMPGSIGQAAERLLRVALSRILAREISALEGAGVRVIRIEPTAHELRLLGANFMDARRAAHVFS